MFQQQGFKTSIEWYIRWFGHYWCTIV